MWVRELRTFKIAIMPSHVTPFKKQKLPDCAIVNDWIMGLSLFGEQVKQHEGE